MALTIPSRSATLSAVFKELVSKELDRQGLKLFHLAEKSGVPYSRLHVWLRGDKTDGGKVRGITSDNLEKVLHALGITLVVKRPGRPRKPSR